MMTILLIIPLNNPIHQIKMTQQFQVSQEYTVQDEAESIHSGVFGSTHDFFIRDTCLGPENVAYSIFTHLEEVDGNTKYIMNVIKWDSEANRVWHRIWNVNGSVIGNSVISDANGVYVTGRYYDDTSDKTFLICYTHSGDEKWIKCPPVGPGKHTVSACPSSYFSSISLATSFSFTMRFEFNLPIATR